MFFCIVPAGVFFSKSRPGHKLNCLGAPFYVCTALTPWGAFTSRITALLTDEKLPYIAGIALVY